MCVNVSSAPCWVCKEWLGGRISTESPLERESGIEGVPHPPQELYRLSLPLCEVKHQGCSG